MSNNLSFTKPCQSCFTLYELHIILKLYFKTEHYIKIACTENGKYSVEVSNYSHGMLDKISSLNGQSAYILEAIVNSNTNYIIFFTILQT